MSRITTVKDKIPKKASWPGFLASGKDSRTKVVLARKLEKQGLGSTPGSSMPTQCRVVQPAKPAQGGANNETRNLIFCLIMVKSRN